MGTLTTDANGNSDTLQLDAKTYYPSEAFAKLVHGVRIKFFFQSANADNSDFHNKTF